MTVYLSESDFRAVVAATPLVSIDLVVGNGRGDVLLGLRNNRPAQGFWFVPGGRILKNEELDVAFRRLTAAELGREVERAHGRLLGVYEHLYSDSVFGDGTDTHYVVLAYRLELDLKLDELPTRQHSAYQWWAEADAARSVEVHANTRAYLSAVGRG